MSSHLRLVGEPSYLEHSPTIADIARDYPGGLDAWIQDIDKALLRQSFTEYVQAEKTRQLQEAMDELERLAQEKAEAESTCARLVSFSRPQT